MISQKDDLSEKSASPIKFWKLKYSFFAPQSQFVYTNSRMCSDTAIGL